MVEEEKYDYEIVEYKHKEMRTKLKSMKNLCDKDDKTWDTKEFNSWIKRPGYLLYYGDDIIGFILYTKPTKAKPYIYIELVCVDNKHRGKGLSGQLLSSVTHYAQLYTIDEIRLEPYNDKLIKLYESYGYVKMEKDDIMKKYLGGKKRRQHKGLDSKSGKLKKGYRYTGKRTKTGLSIIKKV